MGSAQARTGILEEGQVRAMFDRIARVYDLMNSVMTAGLHHRWRERAADLAALEPAGQVVGTDFSEAMLERARRKSAAVQWEWANALELPYSGGSFDAATVGFG